MDLLKRPWSKRPHIVFNDLRNHNKYSCIPGNSWHFCDIFFHEKTELHWRVSTVESFKLDPPGFFARLGVAPKLRGLAFSKSSLGESWKSSRTLESCCARCLEYVWDAKETFSFYSSLNMGSDSCHNIKTGTSATATGFFGRSFFLLSMYWPTM